MIEKNVIDKNVLNMAIIEIKLHINKKLYEKGILTEEIFTKAKELILKGC